METPTIEVRGEVLTLLPEKMICWASRKTLFVADTHFGKAATFRKAGIPVPGGTTATMLMRLTKGIEKCNASRLVILGDFVHSSTRAIDGFEAELVAWRTLHEELDMLLIQGNHDRGHDALFEAMDLRVVNEPYVEEPFALCHYHTANRDDSLHALAGHVHPAIKIGALVGGKTPCFYFSERYSLLPAFGEFTGTEVVKADGNDRVFLVSSDEVIDVTKLVPETKR